MDAGEDFVGDGGVEEGGGIEAGGSGGVAAAAQGAVERFGGEHSRLFGGIGVGGKRG